MVLATGVSHAFSFAVNFVAPWMPMAEYGLMATLVQASGLMMIPAMGLQAVFAQEAASRPPAACQHDVGCKADGMIPTGLELSFPAEVGKDSLWLIATFPSSLIQQSAFLLNIKPNSFISLTAICIYSTLYHCNGDNVEL